MMSTTDEINSRSWICPICRKIVHTGETHVCASESLQNGNGWSGTYTYDNSDILARIAGALEGILAELRKKA